MIPLEVTLAALATDVAIQKKIFRLGVTALIISNSEIRVITKIVKPLKESDLLIEGGSETIENEAEEGKRGFLSSLLGTLSASFSGSMLSGKEIIQAGERRLGQVRIFISASAFN